MKLIEKLFIDWEKEVGQGHTDKHITGIGYMEHKAFFAGFYKAVEVIAAREDYEPFRAAIKELIDEEI